MDAAGNRPFESDPIRRSLHKLFDLPFITIDKSGVFITPLKVVLNYVGRGIRRLGIESSIRGAIDIFARVLIAFAGGFILLVPVIMMTFLTAHHARLIIACCFVVMFAALIGIFTRATNQEVLAATAVYTAVLVVFVAAGI